MRQWLNRLARRWRALRHGDALDRDLSEEIRGHLELESEDLARVRGLTFEAAHREATLAFGGVDTITEAHRDARGVRWLQEFMQDTRYAMRGLRHSPGFTSSAVLVLALGIGASVAAFSTVKAVLLDHKYDRMAIIFEQNSPTNRWSLSTVDFRAIQEQQRSFSDVGALRFSDVSVTVNGEPEHALAALVTSGFFRALRARPGWGRGFDPADEAVGAPPVVVVGNAFATRTFGGGAQAIGKNLTIEGTAYTVVGALRPGVRELAGVRTEIWPVLQLAPPTRRGPFGLRVIGRLAEGVSVETARRDLAGISDRIYPLWTSTGFQDREAHLTPYPMREVLLGDSGQRMLGAFSAAAALVLLIAVANVAGLMFVRVTGRWREVVLRTVLGASRGRVFRLLVTESLVLAVAGAVAGIAVAGLGLPILLAFGPTLPGLTDAHLDGRAVAFAVCLALVAGVVVGAAPVAMLLRRDAARGLRNGDRGSSAGRRTGSVRAAFVIAEFALALPLLAGAGLLLNSFVRMERIRPGFDPQHILRVHVPLPSPRYPNDSTIRPFWTRALAMVRELPGVVDAGLSDQSPPDVQGNANNFDLVDKPVAAGGAQPTSPWPTVSAQYFAVLGVPLVEGRLFLPSDTGVKPVVVVSRAWAKHYYPEGNAIGRGLISGGCIQCPHTVIIGVVGDVKYDGLTGSGDAVYGPQTEGWSRDVTLFVKTTPLPSALLGRVRSVLRSLDHGIPLDDAGPMEDHMYASIAQPRNWTTLLGGFAAVALSLAGVGIFGLLSYTVSARRREIGVRMALGAPKSDVIGMIVRRGMEHAILGGAIGMAMALVATRWLSGVLFEVSATDLPTLSAVTLLLLGVALVGCWLPARRAATIDPVEAIRME